MQRLAVRLIERRNPDDAIVLGDAMNEQGIDGLITGRTRPITFRAIRPGSESIMFTQPGTEAIYNVVSFARLPNEENWKAIWTHWFTSRLDTYHALLTQHLLSPDVRFDELDWSSFFPWRDDDVALGYRLYLVRTPKRRKRPVRTLLMDLLRRASDNPRTEEQHFDDVYQLPLF